MSATAYRSAAVARAWRAGITLARLLEQHDVSRPERVFTSNPKHAGGPSARAMLDARMAGPADLIRLAAQARVPLTPVRQPAEAGREQMYAEIERTGVEITAFWFGPVTGSAS